MVLSQLQMPNLEPENSITHYSKDGNGLQRLKYYMAKWPLRPVFSFCPPGIVDVVFHFGSGGREAKTPEIGYELGREIDDDWRSWEGLILNRPPAGE